MNVKSYLKELTRKQLISTIKIIRRHFKYNLQ